ncbi:hypothetical protein [Sphingopyxis sp. C-1]|uniref:hypothetical protein n=1 Tax=Sphingopyxis sp. C-1 TaxID=262667 RepID=UPI0006BF75D1|nr:hypothetical protein [Sphingopyxis sp. C-1]GAO78680.1 hypothetical protein SC1_01989 [Sphingopyxis sp. C-1]
MDKLSTIAASPSDLSPSGSSQSGIANAGDWIIFKGDRSDAVSVEMKQAIKVSPSIIKFEGGYPRQCHILSVVAAFTDKAAAERLRDSINGVAGEFRRLRRVIEDERSEKITKALEKAHRQIERIVAAAQPKEINP